MTGLSPYQFHSVFVCMTDMTVAEYARRRRMSRAAAELQNGARVLDVALKYGYQSPTAFNRAFRQVHGFAPSEAQRPGARLKSYPPIRFQITVKGVEEMKYHIKPMEAFTVIGKAREFDMENSFAEIPRFWDAYYAQNPCPPVRGCLGVCRESLDGSGRFTYIIADPCEPDAPVPEGYERFAIPAFTWAVFEGQGAMPDALQSLNRRILTEWLPANGEFDLAGGWNVESYSVGDMQSEAYRFELWIPVKRKEEGK